MQSLFINFQHYFIILISLVYFLCHKNIWYKREERRRKNNNSNSRVLFSTQCVFSSFFLTFVTTSYSSSSSPLSSSPSCPFLQHKLYDFCRCRFVSTFIWVLPVSILLWEEENESNLGLHFLMAFFRLETAA